MANKKTQKKPVKPKNKELSLEELALKKYIGKLAKKSKELKKEQPKAAEPQDNEVNELKDIISSLKSDKDNLEQERIMLSDTIQDLKNSINKLKENAIEKENKLSLSVVPDPGEIICDKICEGKYRIALGKDIHQLLIQYRKAYGPLGIISTTFETFFGHNFHLITAPIKLKNGIDASFLTNNVLLRDGSLIINSDKFQLEKMQMFLLENFTDIMEHVANYVKRKSL